MDDLTPEESEALIESVARGIVPDGDDGFAHALTAAHIRPGEPKTAAPSLAGAGGTGMGAGGFMRRTAVGATIGLISLVGVAAAGTAGVVLFASNDSEAEIGELGEEDEVPTETTITTTTTIAESEDEGGDDDGADNSDRERGDEIEGVDSSDGLDDEELALLCEASVNHGEYVSSVAKDKAGREEGESPGARVSEAARTDCGKSDTEDDDADDVDDEAEDDEDDEDVDDDEEDEEGEGPPSHVDGPGNGQGKAKGHSKNGKGNGDS